ncbi:hypothetical protein GCM10022267_31110 [Lentzea roselyniae]|uniref:Cholesterol oxidase substrate-binding domain-containing protein n=1 Tax=Lentzea roselyniae TaxID=531940 RepID=A0ABP7AWM6_9PSEU
MQYEAVAAGLVATRSGDLWGLSKNLLLCIKPTTVRLHANGYAILTRRTHLQQVVHKFAAFHSSLLEAYAARGGYPINGPADIRVTGLDVPADVSVSGAVVSALSAARPHDAHTEWDVAVWVDVLTHANTAGADRFYHEMERFLVNRFTGTDSMVRVERSKGWAYTGSRRWADETMLTHTIPDSYHTGSTVDWNWGVQTLDAMDPHRVFTTALLDNVLQVRGRPQHARDDHGQDHRTRTTLRDDRQCSRPVERARRPWRGRILVSHSPRRAERVSNGHQGVFPSSLSVSRCSWAQFQRAELSRGDGAG